MAVKERVTVELPPGLVSTSRTGGLQPTAPATVTAGGTIEMAVVGGPRPGGGGNVPSKVMVEIARDPERLDPPHAEYQAAKDAANAAQAAAQEAKEELPATREAPAKA